MEFGKRLSTPVVVRLDLSWVAEYSVVTESTVSSTYTFSGVGPQTLGAKYEGGPWKSTYTFNPNQNTSTSQAPGVDDVEVKVTCRPVLAFKIMGVPGPHVTVGLKSEVAGRLANATGDWDLTAESWHETSQKISGTIFGKNVPDLAEEIWETNKVGFSTPIPWQRFREIINAPLKVSLCPIR
ncbi:MAG: hypothetical protein IPP77_14970 [Bacteroidetes bacterium]|nr:hypothetical protein [Bacteroidota bacterium]